MNEYQENCVKEFTLSLKKLQKCDPTKGGGSRFESEYGAAYKEMVRIGIAPQLRKKYRLK